MKRKGETSLDPTTKNFIKKKEAVGVLVAPNELLFLKNQFWKVLVAIIIKIELKGLIKHDEALLKSASQQSGTKKNWKNFVKPSAATSLPDSVAISSSSIARTTTIQSMGKDVTLNRPQQQP